MASPTASQSHVRAVFFDAAGTLFSLRESVGEGYAAVAEQFGFRIDAASAEAAFRRHWSDPPPPSTGTPPEDDGKSWWRQLVYRVLATLDGSRDLEDDRRAACFEALYDHYRDPSRWIPYPETAEVLGLLRRDHPRIALAVVSNFDGRLHGILDGLGLAPFFDHVVVSTEVGYCKPHRGIFEAARESCGSPRASSCLHVGDDPAEDWQGAREAGLAVLELKRPGTDLHGVLEAVRRPSHAH